MSRTTIVVLLVTLAVASGLLLMLVLQRTEYLDKPRSSDALENGNEELSKSAATHDEKRSATAEGCDEDQDCIAHAACISSACVCKSGFNGDGLTVCDDIDECVDPSAFTCHLNATCLNEPGGYYCQCNEGFTGNGKDCIHNLSGTIVNLPDGDSLDCSLYRDTVCHFYAECTRIANGTYKCECETGSKGDGLRGANHTGCVFNAQPCVSNIECPDPLGFCDNTTRTCQCANGYQGDGVTRCDDVNECLDGPCDIHANCENTPGSFLCSCQDGYIGDGFTCNFYCNVDSDCHTNGKCVDTTSCTCKDGFDGDGLDECNDVDECSIPTLNDCSDHAFCTNTNGSFICQCNDGYAGDGRDCIELPHTCHQILLEIGSSVTDGEYQIDPDGPGSLGPVTVFCKFQGGIGITIIYTEDEFPKVITSGFNVVTYKIIVTQIQAIISKSEFCYQAVNYSCSNGGDITGNTFYWMDGNNNMQYNWGGANDGLCPCGQMNQCENPESACNCDGKSSGLHDLGKVVKKELLPIRGVNNGNNPGGDVWFIGEVRCGPQTFDLRTDCHAVKHMDRLYKDRSLFVDFDGPTGALSPVLVFCNMTFDWSVGITEIPHSIKGVLVVNSTSVDVKYSVEVEVLKTLISSSTFCSQEVAYVCQNSGLMNSTLKFRWEDGNNDVQTYFPGALGQANHCPCGVLQTCDREDAVCNCDIMDGINRTDFGTIIDKDDLPVTRMFNFDIGPGRSGRVIIGNLKCSREQFGIHTSCERIFNTGHRISYPYIIDPDGRYGFDGNNVPPFLAECNMILQPPHGVTIIHHYQERRFYMSAIVRSFLIQYKLVTKLQIKALKKQSTYCEQQIKFHCGGLPIFATSGSSFVAWDNIDAIQRNYFNGNGTDNPGCECSAAAQNRCAVSWKRCNCDSEQIGGTDSGFIGNMDDLPLNEVRILQRAQAFLAINRRIDVEVGPMKCYNIYPNCDKIYSFVRAQKLKFIPGDYTIDPDGPGGVTPFVGFCWYRRTYIRVASTTRAGGIWSTPDGVSRCFQIQYENGITSAQVQALVDSSVRCSQHLNYWCKNAPLIGKAYYRTCNGVKQKGWSGSDGQDKCMCGLAGGCNGGPNAKCNCDTEDSVGYNDNARINRKEFLPVCEVCLSLDMLDYAANIKSRYAIFSLSSLTCSSYYPGYHDTCQKIRDHKRGLTEVAEYVNYIDPDRYLGVEAYPVLCVLLVYPPIGFLEIRPITEFYVIEVTMIFISYHVMNTEHILLTIDAARHCTQDITFECSEEYLTISGSFGFYDRIGRLISFLTGYGSSGCSNSVCKCSDIKFTGDRSLLPITGFQFPASSGLRNLTVGPVKCYELYRDCDEIKQANRIWDPMGNGTYAIDPVQQGNGFGVKCDFKTDETIGITEVLYPGGYEYHINVTSFQNITVQYDSVTSVQIRTLVDWSAFCYQAVRVLCTQTALSFNNEQNYEFSSNIGGAVATSFGYGSSSVDCACSNVGTCPSDQACYCDANTATTAADFGVITDGSLLPISDARYWGSQNITGSAEFFLSSIRCAPKIIDFPRDCEEALAQGFGTGEMYIRTPTGGFYVFCDMDMVPGHGVTIIRHNYENVNITVVSQTETITVVYNNATHRQVDDLTKFSAYCFQPMKYKCFNTRFVGKRSFYWRGFQMMFRFDFGGGRANSLQCQCGRQRRCGGHDGWWNMYRRQCNCDVSTDKEWKVDAGIVNGTGALPVWSLNFENDPMVGPSSQGILTLGNLYCSQVDFDLDECEMGYHDCHEQATCINTFGSYECECNEGFRGRGMTPEERETNWSNGRECYDDNECTMGLCPWSSDCYNLIGSYNCTCRSGFTQSGPRTCEDVDECTLGTHNCDVNANCINTEGSFYCRCKQGFRGIGTVGNCYGYATCTAFGDPHYVTYDGTFIHFQGQCRYILSTDGCEGRDPSFIVYTQNWDNGRNTKVLAWVKSVTVVIGATKIDMLQDDKVRVNDYNKVLPVVLANGISVKRTTRFIYLFTSFGLQVTWDGKQVVQVMIPVSYQDKTCGICANWDLMPENDREVGPQAPHSYGEITDDNNLFGQSWTDPDYLATHPECGYVNTTEDCTEEEKQVARNWCDIIFSSKKVEECKNAMPKAEYDHFIETCVYDTCHDPDNRNIDVCNVADAFISVCQEIYKIVIKNWRKKSLCPTECEANEHFEDCALLSQQAVCHNVSVEAMESLEECREGCYCNDGYVLDNGECVRPENCGCFYNGSYYMLNDQFPMTECQQMGTCLSNNSVRIDSTQCHPNASCRLEDGVHGCHCNTGYKGDGYQNCTYDPCWSNPCTGPTECITEGEQYFCKCLLGYYADCESCYDINECETREYKCDDRSECVNTEGSYRCECPAGYIDQNGICIDVDECDIPAANDCGNNSKCINKEGTYECLCCDGFDFNAADICVESGVITGNPERKCCACDDDLCDILGPVCGEDGNTYNSYNSLALAECLSDTYIGMDYRGSCTDDCGDVICESNWETCVEINGQAKCECMPCDSTLDVDVNLNELVCSNALIMYTTICTFLQHQCLQKKNEEIVSNNNLLLCSGTPAGSFVDEWSTWTDCSVSCGQGVKTRTRQLRRQLRPDLIHRVPLFQEAECFEDPCPDSLCFSVNCTTPGAVCVENDDTWECVCRKCINEGDDYVCAIVGGESQNTYQNPCVVKKKACLSNLPFEILNEGYCGEEPTECTKMPDFKLQAQEYGQNCTLFHPLNMGRCAGGCGVITSELCCEPVGTVPKTVEMQCPNIAMPVFKTFDVISDCECRTAAVP